MQYASIINKIRSGDFSLWNASYGLGANMYMLNLFNPMLILLYVIGALFGFEVLPGLLVWWFTGEILLAALAGYLYLSVFPLRESVKGIAAYMYAFNGFMIVWGQHYQFGVACLLVPLFLWTVERFFKDKRRWPAIVIVTAVTVLNSMYLAYMILLMAAFYVIFRLLMIGRKPFKVFFKEGVMTALPMILGLAVGAVSLLPSYAAIRNVSSRLNSDLSVIGRLSGAFTPYPMDYYKTVVDRLLTSTGEGINIFMGYLNYYEAPCLFFSGLFVVLLFQYLIRLPFQKTSARLKILQAVFLLLAGAGLYFPAAGVILNGMTAPFSRYTFLYMPYFMLIAAFTLEGILRDRRVSLTGLALSALFMIWRFRIMILTPWHNPKKALTVLIISGLVMAVLIGALRSAGNKKARTILFAALCLALIGHTSAEGYGNFSGRESLEKDDIYFETLYDADTLRAISGIKAADNGLYRIEKLYGATYCMDALYQDYQPVSVYNSTQNRYIIDFVDTYWPELYYEDSNHYDFVLGVVRSDMALLTGVRYILSAEPVSIDGYSLYDECGTVKIYKSDTSAGLASLYGSGNYTESGDSYACQYDDRDKEAVMAFSATGNDGLIEGTVETANDGVLMMTIPYEDGWHAYVDGVETVIKKADLGFQGIPLGKGKHDIAFRYSCPLFKEGLAVSLTGLILFAALYVFLRRSGRALL